MADSIFITMRRAVFLALLMTTLQTVEARLIDGTAVIVKAPAGKLEGREREDVAAFVGIPYVRTPIGPLRWRAPEPAAPWKSVRAATEFGNDCPQQRLPQDATPSAQLMSEDCLTLNIWRPKNAKALPVMIWIHGGGFVMGSSTSPVLDGAALARRGVVLVSFNYRLGRFGFFAHPALTAEAGGKPSANFAFLDMIAALEWVKKNIPAFGGDPANVTIFGESSGGGAVMFLMASPMTQGLFAKAIIQSGANREPYARLSTERPGRISAERAGVAFTDKAGLRQADVDALRALPADVVQGGLALWDMQADRFTGPVIDGLTVVADPIERFASGAVPKVPFIVGSTGAELSQESYASVMMDLIKGQLSTEVFADLKKAYGDPPDPALIDHYYFTEAARGYARLMSARDVPAWFYVFDHVAEAERAARRGANHASELAYLFGNLPASAGESDRNIAGMMGDYWTQFARSGDPNGGGLPCWPLHGAGDPLLLFGNSGVTVETGRDTARLDAVERAQASRPR